METHSILGHKNEHSCRRYANIKQTWAHAFNSIHAEQCVQFTVKCDDPFTIDSHCNLAKSHTTAYKKFILKAISHGFSIKDGAHNVDFFTN